jgi:hypothetical protein
VKIRRPVKENYLGHGVLEFQLDQWDALFDLINNRLLEYPTFAYRGHAKESWRLRSTLDRLIDVSPTAHADFDRMQHLERFKLAIRGRRGPHPQPLTDEDDWWAIGQHFGLATPLLDWTDNPYVGAFFAFEEEFDFADEDNDSRNRVIYGIEKDLHAYVDSELHPHLSALEFVQPHSDDNARLVNQGGLFTKMPTDFDLETSLVNEIAEDCDQVLLLKIVIPEKAGDRHRFLKALNRMNINYLTLFPDVGGASKHCNSRLLISNY